MADQETKEVQNKEPLKLDKLNPNLKYEVAREPGGEHILSCFQCGTCTADCPVAESDDTYNPRRIIFMTLLGMEDEVLNSDFVWLCTACHTCQERCPQNVCITDLMNAIKNLAVKRGIIHPAYKLQAEILGQQGRLEGVKEFDKKKRAKANLPDVEEKPEDIKKIIEISGLQAEIDKAGK